MPGEPHTATNTSEWLHSCAQVNDNGFSIQGEVLYRWIYADAKTICAYPNVAAAIHLYRRLYMARAAPWMMGNYGDFKFQHTVAGKRQCAWGLRVRRESIFWKNKSDLSFMATVRLGSQNCGSCMPCLRGHSSPFIWMGCCTCGKCREKVSNLFCKTHPQGRRTEQQGAVWFSAPKMLRNFKCMRVPLRINDIPRIC